MSSSSPQGPLWAEMFAPAILMRGYEYYKAGKAKKLQETAEGFSAVVRGTHNYRVTVFADEEGMIEDMTCTCPYANDGNYCKHMAAVMFLIENTYGAIEDHSASDYGRTEKTGSAGSAGRSDTEDRSHNTHGASNSASAPRSAGGASDSTGGGARNDPGRSGNSGSGPDRNDSLPASDREGFQHLPGLQQLRDLVRTGRAEAAEAHSTDTAMEAVGDEYRYFQYRQFRQGLGIDKNTLREAEKLLESYRDQVRRGLAEEPGITYGFSRDPEREEMIGYMSVLFREGHREADVRIRFGRSRLDDVSCGYYRCSYRRYSRSSYLGYSLCAHGVAAVLLLEAVLERDNPGDTTNASGNSFMYSMRRLDAAEVQAAPQNAGSLTLIPSVVIDEDGNLSLSFRAGYGKPYKVQNLQTFYDEMQSGGKMKFGSKTILQLGWNYLTPSSVRWMELIRDEVQGDRQRRERNQARIAKRYYYYRYMPQEESIKSAIPLFGPSLDRFFTLMEREAVEFTVKDYGGKEKYVLTAREEPLQMQLELHADRDPDNGMLQGAVLSGKAPELIYGGEGAYYLKPPYFVRIPAAQLRDLEPLLSEEKDGEIRIRVGRQMLPDFYRKALPRVRELVDLVEYDTELIEAYIPPVPEFVCYLDVDEDFVFCRPDVQYGIKTLGLIDLLDHDDNGAPLESFRDLEKEGAVLEKVMEYLPKYFVDAGVLGIERDDENVFALLDHGIAEIMEHSEVRSTDRFRRLGIRRSVKFDMGVAVESNLLDLDIHSTDLSAKELLEVLTQYQKKRTFYRLKNGDFLKLDGNESLRQLAELMETLQISPKDFVRGKMQIPAYLALYLDKMMEQMNDVYPDRDRTFKTLIKSFKAVEDADYELPESLRGVLRKYQVTGYRWLRTLADAGFGGILADEMGLGKTLQVIAVLLADKLEHEKEALFPEMPEPQEAALLQKTPGRQKKTRPKEIPGRQGEVQLSESTAQTGRHLPSLVVCPASLVYNWGEELRRFAPQLKVVLLAGTKAERSRLLADSADADVIVTSYDLLKRDIDEYEDRQFRFEIIDEAQYIKNHQTAAAKSVKLVRAGTRFALTGTPIENRLSELWSIFDYLMPGFLYQYGEFRSQFELNIVKYENEDVAGRLRRMISPFVLRRKKEDVLRDLPEKLEEVRYAQMEKKQRQLYDGQVVRMRSDLQNQQEEEFRRSRIQILAELTRIRQICCDPSLLYTDYDGGSAKREACMDLLRSAVEGEHKVLVFSQFTTMLELLEKDLEQEGIAYYKITGSVPKEQRMNLVKAFNQDDTPVFLISLKAGGTGLNLTGADIVIHYDPWWNVAVQNQATDRTHRIGQTKVVTVYQLVAKGTIEEKILEMQQNKQKLAEDMLTGESIASGIVTREELLALLG